MYELVTSTRPVGIRCAISTRFSSDNQRKVSLEDQERVCREAIRKENMIVAEDYVVRDAALSGRYKNKRDGLNSLIEVAKKRTGAFSMIAFDHTSRLGAPSPTF